MGHRRVGGRLPADSQHVYKPIALQAWQLAACPKSRIDIFASSAMDQRIRSDPGFSSVPRPLRQRAGVMALSSRDGRTERTSHYELACLPLGKELGQRRVPGSHVDGKRLPA